MILFLYIFISDLVFCLLDSMLSSKVKNGISCMELHIRTLHLYCTDIEHLTHIYQILKYKLLVQLGQFLASVYHCSISFVPSNIKGLHLVYCVYGSAFSNISCLTFVRYCLPSLVLFVTFNSKESKFAHTPNLHYLWFKCICFVWSNHALFCKCNYM